MSLAEGTERLDRIELERIVGLAEASRLSGLSQASLRRNHTDKIIRLGPRRLGMRVKHALLLGDADSSGIS
jgi:hypothetical protein